MLTSYKKTFFYFLCLYVAVLFSFALYGDLEGNVPLSSGREKAVKEKPFLKAKEVIKTKDSSRKKKVFKKEKSSKIKLVQKDPKKEKKDLWRQDMPVRFGSSKLSGFRNNGVLLLEDKVWIHQGDLKLTADKATVYFDTKSDVVDKVFVDGHVTIAKKDLKTNKQISAKSNRARFFIRKKELVLEGEAILTRATEVVAGDRIHYNLDSGEVVGSGVRGIVNPSTTAPSLVD